MSILVAHGVGRSFGPTDIFEDVSVEIAHGARIALVGPNGAGKTTLINILIGLDLPSEGTVSRARGLGIGYLPQRPELHAENTLWEEQLAAFASLRAMESELDALAARMSDDESAIAPYGRLQEAFEEAGGYTYEARIKMVLQGVGFKPEQFHTPLGQFSGGQKTRALLARLLLEEPELLVLDEPTNHLDIDAVEWLEGYLKGYKGAVLAVSHDRYFMDHFATVIWELEWGTLEVYRGNYSAYLVQRQERHERLLKEYEAQQEFLAKEMEYIRRNMAGQNTRQAKGRLRRLETMQKRGRVMQRPRGKRREMSLRLQTQIRSGDKVLMSEGLTVGHDGVPVLKVPDLTLYRGETVALIGGNGAGKSTFLKTVLEQIPAVAGAVRIGASVHVGYFAQGHETLDPKMTVIDAIMNARGMTPAEARSYLGAFLFSGDDVFRTLETLSGGERGRVALARLALSGANLLMLDEPTNHLDIDSQEVLQTVLADFHGTIVLVTHDRYLVDALATQIWVARAGDMDVFEGTYQEYLEQRARQRAQAEAAAASASTSGGRASVSAPGTAAPRKNGLNPFKLKLRITELEAEIEALETQLKALEAAIHAASTGGDAMRVSQLGVAYNETESQLDRTMEEWESLMS
jgi:ATP-binding cassette subfamily F protein 3